MEGILLREDPSEVHVCPQQNLPGWWAQEGPGKGFPLQAPDKPRSKAPIRSGVGPADWPPLVVPLQARISWPRPERPGPVTPRRPRGRCLQEEERTRCSPGLEERHRQPGARAWQGSSLTCPCA